MRRVTTVLVTLAVALTLGAVISTAAVGPGPSLPGIVQVTTEVRGTATEGERRSVFKSVRDRTGKVIGWGVTVCWRVPVQPSEQCVGTFALPKGKLMVSGTRRNQDYWVMAVVGGTGVYAGATGTLVARTYDTRPRRETLIFGIH